MNIKFNNFSLDIFGKSHGEEIGVIITGFPKGIALNNEYTKEMMDRRRPGKSRATTLRDESDEVNIKSGVLKNITSGLPIKAIIKNTNKKSKDYQKLINTPRPAHADLTAFFKYNGTMDMKGGGPFSGRLTAPMVFAGSIAKNELEKKGIFIVSHLLSIGDKFDLKLNHLLYEKKEQKLITTNLFPVIDKELSVRLLPYIDDIRKQLDSIGSQIETVVYNLPIGLGEHSDQSIESRLSKTLFCIPGMKGISFGEGFELATMKASQSNDNIYYNENKEIKTMTNHMGGVLGGISNGMPITFNIVMKPTPSIAKKQHTINLKTKENVIIEINGRHDPCIGIRAVPVVEALSALVMYDLLLESVNE
ncbi:MAG: chorismate synthase [Clostridiales bacterium]|nr:chorismate synthase [Clostridiales bacterium]